LRSNGLRLPALMAPTISSSGKMSASEGSPLLTEGGGLGRGDEGVSFGICCDEGVGAPTSELSTGSRRVDIVKIVRNEHEGLNSVGSAHHLSAGPQSTQKPLYACKDDTNAWFSRASGIPLSGVIQLSECMYQYLMFVLSNQ